MTISLRQIKKPRLKGGCHDHGGEEGEGNLGLDPFWTGIYQQSRKLCTLWCHLKMTTRKEKMFSSFTEAKRPTSCSGSGLHKVADEELALFCFFKAAAAILFQLLQCLQILLQMYFAATARKCLALISASDIFVLCGWSSGRDHKCLDGLTLAQLHINNTSWKQIMTS